MIKNKVLLVMLCLSFGLSLSAQELNLYKQILMPEGPLVGEPLDTLKIRGLVLLSEANNILPQALSRSYVYVANVSHKGKRFVARIPVKGPTSVDFIYEKFTDMMGGHADLIYHFDEKAPIELIYEIKDTNTEKGFAVKKLSKSIPLNSILLTAEAVKVVGDKTPLAEGGIKNLFAMAYRMTSIPERLIGPVINEGRKTTIFDIPFDLAQVRRSFWDTVENQNRIGMSENYNLILNNCITSAIRGLANGLTSEEEMRVERELHRTFNRISTLSSNDMSEAEMKQLFEDYSKIITASKSNISASPIIEKSFFTDWLTKKQKQIGLSHSCRHFFN